MAGNGSAPNARRRKAGVAAGAPPLAMSRAQIAKTVLVMLRDAQEARLKTELVQIANGHGPGDELGPKMDGQRPVYVDGELVMETYAQRLAMHNEQEKRVWDRAGELGVQELVALRIQAEDAAEVTG